MGEPGLDIAAQVAVDTERILLLIWSEIRRMQVGLYIDLNLMCDFIVWLVMCT